MADARTVIESVIVQHMNLGDIPADVRSDLIAAVSSYAETVAAQEREACAQLVCWRCRSGDRPDFQADPSPVWWHGTEECEASPIRQRATPTPGGEET